MNNIVWQYPYAGLDSRVMAGINNVYTNGSKNIAMFLYANVGVFNWWFLSAIIYPAIRLKVCIIRMKQSCNNLYYNWSNTGLHCWMFQEYVYDIAHSPCQWLITPFVKFNIVGWFVSIDTKILKQSICVKHGYILIFIIIPPRIPAICFRQFCWNRLACLMNRFLPKNGCAVFVSPIAITLADLL